MILFVLTSCSNFSMYSFFNTTKESYNRTDEAYAFTKVVANS